jgi:nicotinate-nucleotide adenylyltransferase
VQRIGVFGGTFDPLHTAHLALAAAARRRLRLSRLLWVLTPQPPHKANQHITPLPLRLEMLRAALAGSREFEISTVEIDRPPPHYAVDTVRLVRGQFPQAELVYLMGQDSLRDLPEWHEPAAFLGEVDALGVARRPGAGFDPAALEARLPGVGAKTRWISVPVNPVSSSEIRAKIRQGEPVGGLLPPAVWSIIERENLYRP